MTGSGRKGPVMLVCVGAYALNQRLELLLRGSVLSSGRRQVCFPVREQKKCRNVEVYRSGSSN